MLLPKVLSHLIDKYNEIGFYILHPNKKDIYWSNGKKIEKWYSFAGKINRVLTYNNRLFLCNDFGIVTKYISQQNIKEIHTSDNIFHPLRFFQFYGSGTLVNKNMRAFGYYSTKIELILKNEALSFKFQTPHAFIGLFLKSFDSNLYYFGYGNQHQKYDIKTGIWTKFNFKKDAPIYDIYLFQDKFYVVYCDYSISFFDPNLNQWFQTNLKL